MSPILEEKNLATILTVHMNLMMVYDIVVTDIESIFLNGTYLR